MPTHTLSPMMIGAIPDAANYFMRVVIPDHDLRANQAIVANDDLSAAGDVAAVVDVPGPQPDPSRSSAPSPTRRRYPEKSENSPLTVILEPL